MESKLGEKGKKEVRKSSFSPKVSRPKLPMFSEIRSGSERTKTDPGKDEINLIMEDIMKLNKVDFVKTYSRPKVLRTQSNCPMQLSQSTSTSPVASPMISSASAEPSKFSRSRSRSLKILTDKLKSGRSHNIETSGNIPHTELDYNRASAYGTIRRPWAQVRDNVSKTAVTPEQSIDILKSLPQSDPVVKEAAQEEFPKDKTEMISEDDAAISLSPDECSLNVPAKIPETSDITKSPLLWKRKPFNDAKFVDKTAEDEGVCDGESDSSGAGGMYTYHPMLRDSAFLKLASAPQRRTGMTMLTTLSKVHDAYGPGCMAKASSPIPGEEANGSKQDEQGARRLQRRIDASNGVSSQKSSPGRFITHPPHRKTTFREGGSVDSNGFGSLRSPIEEDRPCDTHDLIPEDSQLSLADSQLCPSEPLSDQDAMDHMMDEMSDSEKRNGKTLKQKSISDPCGDKTRESLDLPKVISSVQAQSVPLLYHEELDSDVSEFHIKEEDSKQRSVSENILPMSASTPDDDTKTDDSEDGIVEHLEVYPTVSTDEDLDEESELWEDASDVEGSSMPSTPRSQSPLPGNKGHHATSRLSSHLKVPTRKPILRSASSASVLQRDRLGFLSAGSKEHDILRKYSDATDEGLGTPASRPSAATVEFASNLGVPGAVQAISMPSVWKASKDRTASEDSPDREKDKRYHIVEELYRNETEYVEALRTLKDKYMVPLKTQSSLDDNIVDSIFYMIPEIFTHHSIYLDFLDNVWKNWNSKASTVGNIILTIFSKQTVLDSYLSFVENYKISGKVNALLNKSSVQKFMEQCQRDSGCKLSMKDLIVRPIQRIPRYELLIQRLLEHTPKDHPDYPHLLLADKTMHELAMKIGTVNDSQQEEDQQETLKKLELLLITDLAVPDRMYIRHDMVQILSNKDQCCIWMFTDVLIMSSVKRKSGPVTRKVSIILQSPTGQDFVDNSKHKTWLRVGLDDVEIVKSHDSLSRKSTIDKEQNEEDLGILNQISGLSGNLTCQHTSLEETLKEMISGITKQLYDHIHRSPAIESNKLELLVTTQEGVHQLIVLFPSAEKRVIWEMALCDVKQKLSVLSDKRAPEFLQPLQITKTRAGMQFSCAAAIDGLNANGYRDVWVCNSDGYVGHMCLLSLQPEPIVTLNTPVPGCTARILCIASIPMYTGGFRRGSRVKHHHRHQLSPSHDRPRISVDAVDSLESIGEDGYQSDTESSDDDLLTFIPVCSELFVADEDCQPSRPLMADSGHDTITQSGTWTQEAHKSTMWLGTEDGCIHIFLCTDNIKTTKNKLKIQHSAAIYCIVYLDNKVFVALANGDLLVYRRDSDGLWVTETPYTRTIGTPTSPITKILAVAGKLWCGSLNNILVINPLTLVTERSFAISSDSGRTVQCMVSSGQGVWVASQQSSKVLLYHATTFDFLMEVNISPAVCQKLQSADDIIRQHKAACLRITALLICKDLLWIGTSAGVILTIPIHKISSMTTKGSLNPPTVTGLVYGHTGHVRFLTSVELPTSMQQKLDNNNGDDGQSVSMHDIKRRSSMATTATMATRMLLISGGDGYEDFRTTSSNESAGRDDSTNHLLLWQV